jgi:hypothetical protein
LEIGDLGPVSPLLHNLGQELLVITREDAELEVGGGILRCLLLVKNDVHGILVLLQLSL